MNPVIADFPRAIFVMPFVGALLVRFFQQLASSRFKIGLYKGKSSQEIGKYILLGSLPWIGAVCLGFFIPRYISSFLYASAYLFIVTAVALALSHKVTGATGGIPVYLALLFVGIAVGVLVSLGEFAVFGKSILHIKTIGNSAELTYKGSIIIERVGRFQDILIWAVGIMLALIPAGATIMVTVFRGREDKRPWRLIQVYIAMLLGGTCYALVMIYFWIYEPLANYGQQVYDLLIFGP